MVLFEVSSIDAYVPEDELQCEHPVLRAVEATMLEHLHHFDEVGDDIVFEPYYRLGWDIRDTGWGVDVVQIPGPTAADGSSIGYTFNFPLKTPADVELLRPRQFTVDREGTTAKLRLLEDVFGATLALEPVPYSEYESFEQARAAYEEEDPVRLVLESGAGDPSQPGAPVGSAEYRFEQWPPSDVTALPFYFGPDGTLAVAEPAADGGASRYDFDAELANTVTLPGGSGDAFLALPPYEWNQEPEGSAAVFLSEPLSEDLALAGSASADLFIRSSADEADIGVTLSEVRPDGQEVYIQSGVLRGKNRALGDNATDLWPEHTGYEEDQVPMPVDEFTEARVEIFPFAHVIRAGSSIRLSVHTPGGDKVRWEYILAEGQEGATFDIAHAADMASRLVLPVTSQISGYPAELPPCPGLRAQPCRDFAPYANTPAP